MDAAKARDCALRLLARRDHSKAELQRKLIQRGFARPVIESVISRLAEAGYLDDHRFARRWAESALESGRCVGSRLRLELRQRGVPTDIAEQTVSELASGFEEFPAARSLLERKFPGFDPAAADDREKRRIFGFLQRRGFPTATIIALFRGSIQED
jgi:regulatory protein